MTLKLLWACPHQSLFLAQILSKNGGHEKNINLKKWLFQIGWIIINAIWLFSVLRWISM